MIDFVFNVSKGDIIYDIETYPNIFTLYAIHSKTNQEWLFEISNRKNDLNLICLFLETLKQFKCRMVGFNNIGFDYPVIHSLYKNKKFITLKNIYDKAMGIINSDDRFSNIIWDTKQIVEQLDLMKIHHFDNMARSTSLKILQFNMRSESIEDLPYSPGSILTTNQMDNLIKYNRHDVLETLKFYNETKEKIKFREELSLKYDKNFMNHNDTKIGKDYFIMKLEEYKPGSCYRKVDDKRKPVQTYRPHINIKDIILPYIKFDHPEFNRVLNFFKNTTITQTKGAFKDINCIVNGFQFDFGTGGIHGSVSNKIVKSENGYVIEDWDVASYYPNISISNNFHPKHLGKDFCRIYKDVYEQRKSYPKGTSENAMLKLALNGVYGDSNNEYSPFYDPQYTMSITINGQLLLCMLAEKLINLTSLELIQINTDGLTVRYPSIMKESVHLVCRNWEKLTSLSLENIEYSKMCIRDVNNYISECFPENWSEPDIKNVKRKGAYEYKREWHQNCSALVIPMAAESYLLKGVQINKFIKNHEDVMDFMLRVKLPKSNILKWGGETIQNTSRYYISTDGDYLEKTMPANGTIGSYKRKNKISDLYYKTILNEIGSKWDNRIHTNNKSKYEDRISCIHPGWTVQICNDINNHTFTDINYDYYIKETEKLVKDLKLN